MKLKNKLYLISIAVILIPTLISLAFVIILYSSTNNQTKRIGLENSFHLVQNEILTFEQETLESAKTLAGEKYIKDKVYIYSKYWDFMGSQSLDYDLQILESTLNDYLITSSFDSVGIYRVDDDTYEKIVSFGDDLNMSKSYSKIENSKASIHYEFFNNAIFMITKYPIFLEGSIVGMMLIRNRMDSSYVKRIADQYELDLVIVRNQEVLLSTFKDFDPSFTTEEDNYFSHRIDDTQYVFYREKLLEDSIPLDIYIIRQQESLLRGLGREIMILLGICVFGMFFPAIILTIWGRNLINDLVPLSDGAASISKNDYTYQIETTSRKDEFGLLYTSFNSMINTIAKNRTILEDRNTTLAMINSYIEAVFNILLVSVVIVDNDNIVKLVNDSGKKELLQTAQDIIYEHDLFRIKFFSDNRDYINRYIKQFNDSSEHIKTDEINWEGSTYAVEMFPLRTGETRSGIIFVILNITENVQMERAIIQSERLAVVGKLSAAMAHEINNPMGILLNHVQLLQTGKLSEEQKEIFLSRMESEITRVNKLIRSLLDYGKTQSSEYKIISMNELIQQVCSLFELKFLRKDIEASFTPVVDTALFVHGDRDQLKQVFFNIINNAIQAIPTDKKGEVHVSLIADEDHVDVNITDNGTGMADEIQYHIFDDFFSEKGDEGMGLGLAVSKQIIKRHAGSISVTSELGVGSTFTVTLPLISEGDTKSV